MKTLTFLLASVACCLSAAPALSANGNAPVTVAAPGSDDPATIRVPYGDLNLANEADASVLRARVKQATLRKCGELHDTSFIQLFRACRDITWRYAKPQIADAVDRAKSGQPAMATNLVVSAPRVR